MTARYYFCSMGTVLAGIGFAGMNGCLWVWRENRWRVCWELELYVSMRSECKSCSYSYNELEKSSAVSQCPQHPAGSTRLVDSLPVAMRVRVCTSGVF
jgi:hypothetical protein